MTCLVCTREGGEPVRLVLTVPTYPIAMCMACRIRWAEKFGVETVLATRKTGGTSSPPVPRAATTPSAGQRAA